MKKIREFMLKRGATLLSAVALFVAVGSITQACWLNFNQPEMPEELRDFKK